LIDVVLGAAALASDVARTAWSRPRRGASLSAPTIQLKPRNGGGWLGAVLASIVRPWTRGRRARPPDAHRARGSRASTAAIPHRTAPRDGSRLSPRGQGMHEHSASENEHAPMSTPRADTSGAKAESSAREAPSKEAEAVALARLAAGLAHEIKNPLSTMAINLALLEEEWGRAAQARGEAQAEPTAREKRCVKRVQSLQREVRRLETIVEDFLRYARGGEVNRLPQDLGALVREVLDFVDLEDSRQGIRHHIDLPAGLPLVMLDPGALRQALLNLFVNARQAMPLGGELIVRTRRQGNFVELSITDTGVGMRAEDLQRCFDVYFSTKKGGTGLGLATTRRIVEEHGGTITVVSEPGRGTSFSIVLPLLVEIHSQAQSRPAAESALDSAEDRLEEEA
jgi:signal transduction histidine kinase